MHARRAAPAGPRGAAAGGSGLARAGLSPEKRKLGARALLLSPRRKAGGLAHKAGIPTATRGTLSKPCASHAQAFCARTAGAGIKIRGVGRGREGRGRPPTRGAGGRGAGRGRRQSRSASAPGAEAGSEGAPAASPRTPRRPLSRAPAPSARPPPPGAVAAPGQQFRSPDPPGRRRPGRAPSRASPRGAQPAPGSPGKESPRAPTASQPLRARGALLPPPRPRGTREGARRRASRMGRSREPDAPRVH